jgi:hypothetical protein
MKPSVSLAAVLVLAPTFASAQAVNVDFGAGSAPSSSYSAVGAAGVWNVVGVLPPGQRAPLLGPDGGTIGAQIYMIGGTSLLAANDPATAGDDEALLDDMLIGFNNPVDVCVWFEYLQNGGYDVILYALTPNDPDLMSRTRVDFASPDPTEVGGAWSGVHESKVSYARFTVSVTDGTIGLHSGLWGTLVQSGLNGIQLLPHSAMDAAIRSLGRERLGIRAIAPTPFATSTEVSFEVPSAANVTLSIWDVAGRRIVTVLDAPLGPGMHRASWDGRDAAGRWLPSGVYFCRVAAGAETAYGKMTLAR